MATSLSKIRSQIEKLQRRAASIESTIISRIKKEIAQHGLSVSDLFGSDKKDSGPVRATGKVAAKSKNELPAKPAKFSDGQGNTWHGIGKRPRWIHDALGSGRSLEELLIGAKSSTSAPRAEAVAIDAKAKTAGKKAVATKKSAGAKAAPAKNVAKAPATKKAPVPATTAKPAKADKSVPAASKSPAKKAPAKKAAPKKLASRRAAAAASPLSTEVAAPTT